MKDKLHLIAVVLVTLMLTTHTEASENWKALFETETTSEANIDSALTLQKAFLNVANTSPLFQSFHFQLQAVKNNQSQASAWAKPEISIEIEEFGWNAPQFKESEITMSISQEFDFFGQRNARKKYAETQLDVIKLHLNLSAFDLYILVQQRFYQLAHAQQERKLSQHAVDLSHQIVENIRFRLQKGAALHSELLLAQMEEQISILNFEQTEQKIIVLETKLVSLWGGEVTGKVLDADLEPNLDTILQTLEKLTSDIDRTRELKKFNNQLDILNAEYNLSLAESKPTVTLSGGIKRLELNNSKSFLFGVSLPIPFINKDKGTQKSIQSNIAALQYEKQHLQNEVSTMILSSLINLKQLESRHKSLDTLLIPTATHAFKTLKKDYDAGRVPYTHLLEAERTLNELNFEHNDMLLHIQNLIIEIESVNGILLNTKRDN